MSGLREIIEWVEREIILDPASTVDEQFEDISRIFERDNRLPLADILRDDQAEFFKFLESELPRIRAQPKADKDIRTPKRPVSSFERGIENILQGARNLLKRVFG